MVKITTFNDWPVRHVRYMTDGTVILKLYERRPNRQVHLHVCATDGVFTSTADGPACDAPQAFLPAHDERDAIQASPDELPVIDIHLL